MTVEYKTNSLWLCLRLASPARASARSDGEEGPDDGSGHIHPESVFNFDLHSGGFYKLVH